RGDPAASARRGVAVHRAAAHGHVAAVVDVHAAAVTCAGVGGEGDLVEQGLVATALVVEAPAGAGGAVPGERRRVDLAAEVVEHAAAGVGLVVGDRRVLEQQRAVGVDAATLVARGGRAGAEAVARHRDVVAVQRAA